MLVLVDPLIFLVKYSFKNVYSIILKNYNYKKITTGTNKIIADIKGVNFVEDDIYLTN